MFTFFKTKLGMVVGAVLLVVVILIVRRVTAKPASVATIVAQTGDIKEQISVTGSVTSSDTANLSFQSSGRLARVNVVVGSRVGAGQVLMALDTTQLQAQRQLQQAQINGAQAKLNQVQAGATPADIAVAQSAVATAQNTLIQIQTKTALDASRKDINAVTDALQLISNIDDPLYLVKQDMNTGALNSPIGQVRLSIYGNSSSNSTTTGGLLGQLNGSQIDTTDSILEKTKVDLVTTQGILDIAYADLVQESASATTTSLVTTARSNVLTALNDIDTQIQALITAENNVQNAQAALTLKQSPPTANDIAIAQASLDEATANLAIINAQINQDVIVAPVAGVITAVNFKVGETVNASAIATTLLNDSHFEIDSNVPETDIGKVAVGDPVSLTLDAFQGETFTGKVSQIDPAQQIIDGVVVFKVTVLFDKADPRLKSGLTANLSIQTAEKDGVVVLPQVAILENDSGTFVVKVVKGVATQTPITIGLRASDGSVEITSGVQAGDTVQNIGLKKN